MKKLLVLFLGVAFATQVQAQIKTPAASPSQKIEQKVGLTDVTLEYSRPSVKGRTIFGDLVPFDQLWRTGANENTKITFSNDVMIGGSEVKAGTYAIYTKPMDSKWDVYFYSDSNNWGNPAKWDDDKVVATVKADVYPMPMPIETFTMSFDDLTNDSAVVGIMWDKSYVAVPFKVHTDKMVTASIENTMNGPAANDYYSAAVYYLENGKDINQAKIWIDKAVGMNANAFWYKRQQSLIYAKSGDKKGAIKAAKESLAQAKEQGNADYVALNEKSLKEWGEM